MRRRIQPSCSVPELRPPPPACVSEHPTRPEREGVPAASLDHSLVAAYLTSVPGTPWDSRRTTAQMVPGPSSVPDMA
eukprot:3369914-Rhodomonas_salina.4